MNIVDSSGWLEYFAEGKNAAFFAPAITKTAELIVPTVSLYEVFKRVHQPRGESEALVAVALTVHLTSSRSHRNSLGLGAGSPGP